MNFFSSCFRFNQIEPQIEIVENIPQQTQSLHLNEWDIKKQTRKYIKQALLYLFGKVSLSPTLGFDLNPMRLNYGYSYDEYFHYLALKLNEVLSDKKEIPFELKNQTKSQIIRRVSSKINLYQVLNYLKINQDNLFIEDLRVPAVFSLLLNILNDPTNETEYKSLSELLCLPDISFNKVGVKDQDVEMIEIMTKHERAIHAIRKINNIRQEEDFPIESTESHIKSLISDLKIRQVIQVMGSKEFNGLTTYDGVIYIDASLCQNFKNQKDEKIKTIIRQVTLLHEIMGHVKRLKFSDPTDVLQKTPPIDVEGKLIDEVGFVVETILFGSILTSQNITEEFVEAYFKKENWHNNFQFQDLVLDKLDFQNNSRLRRYVDENHNKEEENGFVDKPRCIGYYRCRKQLEAYFEKLY